MSYDEHFNAIKDADDDDFIMLSDNDEIPNLNSEDFKKNKELDQEIPMKFKKWLCEKLIEEGGEVQIGKEFYGNKEPFKNLPEKYFYDDSFIMDAFKRIAKAQAKNKLN